MEEHPATKLSLNNLILGAAEIELNPSRFGNKINTDIRDIIYEYQEQNQQLIKETFEKCKKISPETLRILILNTCTKEELDEIVDSTRD